MSEEERKEALEGMSENARIMFSFTMEVKRLCDDYLEMDDVAVGNIVGALAAVQFGLFYEVMKG